MIVSELYLATKLALEVSLKRVHLIVDFHYVFVYCVLLLQEKTHTHQDRHKHRKPSKSHSVVNRQHRHYAMMSRAVRGGGESRTEIWFISRR